MYLKQKHGDNTVWDKVEAGKGQGQGWENGVEPWASMWPPEHLVGNSWNGPTWATKRTSCSSNPKSLKKGRKSENE